MNVFWKIKFYNMKYSITWHNK